MISLVSGYHHHHPSVRHLVIHQDIWLSQKIVFVHHSEKHSMEHIVYSFLGQKSTPNVKNPAIKNDFIFSSIITTNIQKILKSSNYYGEAEKVPTMSQVLSSKQHICFWTSNMRASGSNMGAANLFLAFLPRAPSNFVMPYSRGGEPFS